ncbi:SbcC/MukB-like Walker B domain-containing protein [Nocardia sp. NPDC050697]|uniref:ATP-binding protein n=1 Tax=Nocardia sp. NPDC050697 TaxID=3155158 RepID=UPI0033D536B0
MLDTLFGMIPAASRGEQWVARDLQLVNWGGYDGYHRVRFAPGATLLCGASGSGKSTLMDSYIALIMPHTMPFNGASNGGVAGRPRGKDQRNIVSYARGKLDESRAGGETRARVLRGADRDTWSAIAMTWADDHSGATFTAVRAWYVPATARVVDDLTSVRGTRDDTFDLRALTAAAERRFTDTAVRAAGLTPHRTDRDFTARLHTALGIGAAGDGHKAVALLGRIQAGQQITTVDALYKTMVLEEPSTIATAEEVVRQFDELSGTRTQMTTARQQVRALTAIRGHRADIAAAAERAALLAGIGTFGDPASPAGRWRQERRVALLEAAERELTQRLERTAREVAEQELLVTAATTTRDALRDTLRAAGGDRLATAARELEAARERLAQVRRSRAQLDLDLAALDATATDAAAFAALAEAAHRALADGDARKTAQARYAEATAAARDADRTVLALRADRAAVAARRDNIPGNLHAAREALARAAGLTPADLPFVGELIEVRTQFEPWREAFDLALGGFATKMLIDVAHLGAFRDAVNAVRTPVRLRYEGVPTGGRADIGLDDRRLPGRLDYRPSVFTAWLKHELVRQFDFVCVDTPRLLGQYDKALTIAGQTAEGRRGAHGSHGRTTVLGFTNQRRLAQFDTEIEQAEKLAADAAASAAEAQSALDRFEDRRGAYRRLTELTWEQVDIDAATADRDRWRAVIDDIDSGDPDIDRHRASLAEQNERVTELTEGAGRLKGREEQLAATLAATTAQAEQARRALAAPAELTPAHRDYLGSLFPAAESDPPEQALRAFDDAAGRAADRLGADLAAARATAEHARTALAEIFATFVERWPNPNLGTDPDGSYPDFERLLTDLETSRLHELETQWRDSLLKLSGNDLTSLDSELAAAIREIRDRIEPVNRILAALPFSDDEHRLRIDPRESHSAVRARFRRELREVRARIDAAATDDDRERVYRRMAKLIDRIRRTAPDFADLVDVRNHIRISAEKVDADGAHVALYDHIGEKSGGESQELVAFIVGSALRYQLGDAGAERPRYAPVFLDEALIKADARYTGRAIGAWRGLGFQLVIGAPNDKTSAIEPHIDAEYLVLKNAENRSWAKPIIGVPEQDG